MTEGHIYKTVTLVGSSDSSIEEAVQGAIERASETLRNLDWFEVVETRGQVVDGKVEWYQVKLNAGFRIEQPADMQQG